MLDDLGAWYTDTLGGEQDAQIADFDLLRQQEAERDADVKRVTRQRALNLARQESPQGYRHGVKAVRRCVTEHLTTEQAAPTRATLVREALTVAGTYRDPKGLTDVARNHDEHLADAQRK